MSESEVIDAEVIEDETHNLPAVRAAEAIIARGELSVDEVVEQKGKIVAIMQRVMTDGVHYGVIPGVNKPTLLKPGAEAINVALRLAPHYDSEKIWHEDGHLTVTARCTLKHIPTDLTVATGEGLCTSRESKYAYRTGGRACPECGKDAIIKGKEQYGGGWLCFKKKGGCGAKWEDGSAQAQEFANAETGRVPNEDLPDTFNTVLKMADKRALVAAVLNGTAASDVFTQDVEDGGAAGATAAQSDSRDVQTSVEGAEDVTRGLPKPKTWDDLESLIRPLGNVLWEDFMIFATETRHMLYPDREQEGLSQFEKDVFWRVCARAALLLRGAHSPGMFPPPVREDFVVAFRAALGSENVFDANLAGPAWRMSPDENLPTREELNAAGS